MLPTNPAMKPATVAGFHETPVADSKSGNESGSCCRILSPAAGRTPGERLQGTGAAAERGDPWGPHLWRDGANLIELADQF